MESRRFLQLPLNVQNTLPILSESIGASVELRILDRLRDKLDSNAPVLALEGLGFRGALDALHQAYADSARSTANVQHKNRLGRRG